MATSKQSGKAMKSKKGSSAVSKWMGKIALDTHLKVAASQKELGQCDAVVLFARDAKKTLSAAFSLSGWSKKKWDEYVKAAKSSSPSDLAVELMAEKPTFVVQVNTPGAAKGSGPKGASAKASGEFQSPQSKWRDAAGKWLSWCLRSGFSKVELRFNGLDEQEIQAVLVGIELGYYRFCISNAPIGSRPEFLTSSKIKKETLAGAQTLGQSVNWARELVNLPPADLEPESYASLCKKWFKQYPQIKVDVWDDAKLAKQGCNLHLAVGQAAPQGPRLVKISYRPEKKKSKKTFAFVGKGITFDSGGLDIKPAAGMRYMKKDMGGSAAVFGLANYVARTQPKQSYDFYLAIAENAIASNAFHPSDIITGHNGKTVEIHNTDAEGRLVLADAMSVAQKSADLDGLVDVGTLTGAMRVAVGLDIIGICSNAGKLGAAAMRAGYASGDPSWQLPLFPAYNAMLRSDFADVLNCSPGRYAGGITAALFLQHFVEDGVPWLHMDMNAYAHSPSGACLQGGGNGQGVQMLAALVDSWCEA